MLINSGFHTRNKLAENIQQFVHAPSELFANPILGRKCLMNIDLKGGRINLAGVPTCVGPAVVVRRRLVFVYRRFGTGTPRPLKQGTDGLFHNSVTNYHPTSRSVPKYRRLISHVCYLMHGSQSFLTIYQPFK